MNYNFVVALATHNQMSTFSEWLLSNRKSKRMTQAQVAKRAGVSVSYVSTLERNQPHSTTGATLRPEPDKVRALAKAVGGDEDEALISAGYAPTHLTQKPRNLQEFLEALESMGIEHFQAFDNINDLTEDEYDLLLTQIRSIIDATIHRKVRPRPKLYDPGDNLEDDLDLEDTDDSSRKAGLKKGVTR